MKKAADYQQLLKGGYGHTGRIGYLSPGIGSVVSCVGIWCDAISGISRVASQAARSIG
jgi:hypothetical protein